MSQNSPTYRPVLTEQLKRFDRAITEYRAPVDAEWHFHTGGAIYTASVLITDMILWARANHIDFEEILGYGRANADCFFHEIRPTKTT